MAESKDGQSPQDLECPLCRDIFNFATMLGSGHTFCKNCLIEHDRTHMALRHIMICPVCRKRTKLGSKRVEGLPQNKAVKGLIDDIKEKHTKANTQTVGSTNVSKSQNAPGGTMAPSSVTNSSMSIVRRVDLPASMVGMAVMSQDTVMLGYGGAINNALIYRLSGDEVSSHPMSKVRCVSDITFLTDGRFVSSLGDKIYVHTADGSPAGMQYANSPCDGLCSDHLNTIYAVNGDSEISIKGTGIPQRVVHTGSHRPRQICVTKTGVMITSTCWSTPSTVMVHDREGRAGCSIKGSDDGEYLYAAVDSQDRVFVARVRYKSYKLRLSVYTMAGTKLVMQREFNELKLHGCIGSLLSMWCYMVCLTPHLLAFAHHRYLYFVAVPS